MDGDELSESARSRSFLLGRRLAGAAQVLALAALLVLVITGPALGRPPFVDLVICGTNEGWASAPTVFIDTDGAPSIGGDSSVLLVRDAISDYWNEGPDIDGENENGASSAFKGPGPGFGAVTTGTVPGAQEIVVSFAALPSGVLGQASCEVDGSGGAIVGASVILTTDVAGLSDEAYKNTAAHELGHAIGLPHQGRPGTMMHSFIFVGLSAYLPLARASLRVLNRNYG